VFVFIQLSYFKNSRITAAEMKNTRRTAGYTRADHKTNIELARELNITPILDRIYDQKKNCE
jgi:hypothetical protein